MSWEVTIKKNKCNCVNNVCTLYCTFMTMCIEKY